MVSHLTGSDELVFIQTEQVSVTIKGSAFYPQSKALGTQEDVAMFSLSGTAKPEIVRILGEDVTSLGHRIAMKPVFYEQNSYEIVIENRKDGHVAFYHANPNIRKSVTPVGTKGSLLTGMINFGNDIGYSDFVILLGGKEYLRFTVEVFPEKISYQKDYRAIVADVTDELYNLVFDFLKKTYFGFEQRNRRSSSPVEFYSVISRIFKGYLRALDKIIKEPHHELQAFHEVVPGYRAHRIDRQTVRWIEKHPDSVKREDNRILADKVLALTKKVSYDTRENQLVLFMIHSTVQRLRNFRERYAAMSRQADQVIISRVDQMIGTLNRRVQGSFLNRIEETGGKTGMSLVFTMGSGYKELYRYFLMLERGLDITGDVFHMSVKDLAQLYEYWCFIKLNHLLKEKYELVSQDILRTEGSRLFVTLVKGKGSRVRYRNPRNGEAIELSYNPSSSNLPTVPQKPDNVLTLEKKSPVSGKMKYKYVFDAKYKIDPALSDSYYYNVISHTPGPKEEDINTMHRYRDAIVSEEGSDFFRRTMFGAYVLFPYGQEEEYKKHKFYESIDKVNIGGLPFLPQATNLVEQKLDELIDDSPETAFEETVLPVGIEKKLARVDWNERDVLVGTLKNRHQLEVCKKYKFYHIPVERLNENALPIHYVAIYQSRNLFGKDSGVFLYGEVVRTEIVPRWKIKEIPRNSDKLYYRFTIKQWKKLRHPIGVRESAEVAFLTNMFLLQHSEELPDLKIASEEEYRLYYELRRMTQQQVEENKDMSLCYRCGSNIVDCVDGNIRLIRDGKIKLSLSAELFKRHPGQYFKYLQRRMKVQEG
jgi:predicted component of viral defense system (DUF524 family)